SVVYADPAGRFSVTRPPVNWLHWALALIRPSPGSFRKNGVPRALSRTGRVGPSQPERSGPTGQTRWYRGRTLPGVDRPRTQARFEGPRQNDQRAPLSPAHRIR